MPLEEAIILGLHMALENTEALDEYDPAYQALHEVEPGDMLKYPLTAGILDDRPRARLICSGQPLNARGGA